MNKALINKHNFDIAKANIDRFSRNLPSYPSFNRVEIDGGLFGWGDHKVTGSEMNDFIGKVQDKLISVNTSLRSIVGEFREVYKAFDFLDGEYINGIIESIESAEKAGQEALQAQKDIAKTVDSLQKTILGLVNLKAIVERIDEKVKTIDKKVIDFVVIGNALKKIQPYFSSITHIKDIDTIWNDLQKTKQVVDAIRNDVEGHKKDLSSFHKRVDSFVEKTNQSTARIYADINALQKFRTLLESYHHLGDVDAIWSDVEGHKKDLSSFHEQMDSLVEKTNQSIARINADIGALHEFRTLLESYQHLGDVDTIWSDVEGIKKELLDIHKNLDSFIDATHSEQEKIKETIRQMEADNDLMRQQYNKKMKIAYWIGGCAAGLTIVNYILQFIGLL